VGVMVFARPVLALVVVFASPSNGWHEFRPSRLFDPVGHVGCPHNTPSWCGSEAHLPTRGTDPIAGVRTQAVATLLAR
jgi:hypothetical protein